MEAFIDAGITASKGAARRDADGGGLSVNGEKISAEELQREVADLSALPGGHLLLRRGRKNAAMIRIAGFDGTTGRQATRRSAERRAPGDVHQTSPGALPRPGARWRRADVLETRTAPGRRGGVVAGRGIYVSASETVKPTISLGDPLSDVGHIRMNERFPRSLKCAMTCMYDAPTG